MTAANIEVGRTYRSLSGVEHGVSAGNRQEDGRREALRTQLMGLPAGRGRAEVSDAIPTLGAGLR
jgi:hypothetical protein